MLETLHNFGWGIHKDTLPIYSRLPKLRGVHNFKTASQPLKFATITLQPQKFPPKALRFAC
jgi:hypothetical protein